MRARAAVRQLQRRSSTLIRRTGEDFLLPPSSASVDAEVGGGIGGGDGGGAGITAPLLVPVRGLLFPSFVLQSERDAIVFFFFFFFAALDQR